MKYIRKHLKKLRLRTLISLGLLLIVLPIVAFTLFAPSSITATWYNDHYAYRQRFEFTHNASVTSARKITFTLDTAELITAGVMQSDCDDTRFTDANGKELKYDLTGTCNNASTTYEVIFPTVLNAIQYAYVYYGNPTATNAEISSTSYTALTPSGGDPSAITNRTNESQAPSPTVYLALDENTDNSCTDGTDACDSTSNANNATFAATTESPTWVDPSQCIKGSCLYFDGTDDYAAIQSATSLDMSETTSMTISAWIKTNSTGSFQNIFRYDDCDTADGDGSCGAGRDIYYVRLGTANKLQFGYGDTGTGLSSIASNTTIEPNKWYYVVAVRDVASDTEKIYINGVLDNSETDTTTGTWVTSGQYPVIGHYPSEEYGGLVDELKVYNYARTADEIKQDFAVGGSDVGSSAVLGSHDMSTLSDGLVGYWPMEDSVSGDAQSITDETGNGYTATTNGAGVDCTVEGKFGLGCDIGASESLEVPDNDVFSLNNTNEFTASAWVTPTSINAHSIFDKGASGNFEWSLGYDSNGYAIASIYTSTGTVFMRVTTNTNAISAGETALISMSVDLNAPLLSLYKNGELLGTDTTSSGSYTNGTATLEIGELVFDGVLDDARIYNRALSSSEIAQLYNWAPKPIVYYDFDENTGTSTVNDTSGSKNTATMNGSMTEADWVPGKFGSSLDFDGSNDRLYDSNVDLPTQSFTYAFWVNLDNTSYRTFLDASSGSGNEFTLIYDGSLDVYLNGSYAFSGSALTAGQWTHVAVTRSGSAVTVYLNGVENASGTNGTALDFGSCGLNIGADVWSSCNSSFGGYLDGKLDELKVYNYARSQTQIIEDMNGNHPIGGSPIGSQNVYYKFDEGSGTTANNSVITHQSVTGSVSGATITLSGCKYNNCLDFDGSNDVVTVTNTSAIDLDGALSSGFTISTWINADSDGEGGVGNIFTKGTNIWCRTDSESGGLTDLECSLDLATSDATLNIADAITIGQWHHVAITYTDDDDDEITIYVDGINVGSSTNGSGAPSADTSNLLIGGTTSANFDGTIDDFKIYSSELNATQLEVDMNANAAINFGTGTSKTDDYSFTIPQPVGHWEFNENTGSGAFTTYDTSINSNNGVADSTMTESDWVPGVSGSALDFDGTDDYVSITNSNEIDFDVGLASGFSISGWIYIRSDGSSNQGRFLQKGNARCDTRSETGSTVTIACNLDLTGTNVFDTSSGVTKNEWHHFVYVYDNASSLAFYLDGVEILGGTGTGDTDPDTGDLYIGGGNTFFDGRIDDYKVFDTPLTQTQVNYEYNQGKPVAHWKLDECQGTTAYDSSDNGLNGTVSIGGTGSNTTPGTCSGSAGEAWNDGESGKFNSALEFDGTDDYITISDSSILSPGANNYTISAWYKTSTNFSTSAWIYYSSGTATNNLAFLGMSEFETITCVYRDGDGDLTQATDPDTSSDGAWHLATCVRDGTSAKLYIDGMLKATSTNASLGTINVTGYGEAIGTHNVSTGSQNFTGLIDDVRIYNYDLSQPQIKQLYNGGAIRFGPETGSP